ncbi:hypothetical protein BGZ58_003513, partial [Dissophora ornata]
TAPLINFNMWKMIIGQAIFQIILNLTLLRYGAKLFHLESADGTMTPEHLLTLRTMIFNAFVFLQVFNELNCRRIDDTLNVFKNLHHNKIFIFVQVVVVVGQVMIVQFGGLAFKTTPLSGHQWLLTVLIGSLSLPVGLFLRLLPAKLEAIIPHIAEEHQPLVSPARMRWEGASNQMIMEGNFFEAIRKKKARGSNTEDVAKKSLWTKAYGAALTDLSSSE